MVAAESAFRVFVNAIAAGDVAVALPLLATSPTLATERAASGATRQAPTASYLDRIGHYLYSGDTALHISAASYQPEIARLLLAAGADVHARNRRGAQPLHYAADGSPGSAHWRPDAQAATIAGLIAAGADPNAVDKSGVAALHRAVRTRCAAAVGALLDGGADPRLANKNGSTASMLATRTTGRGGSGTPAAKAQQEEIVRLLAAAS